MTDLNDLADRIAAEDAADDATAAPTDPTLVPFEGWADAGVGSRDLSDVEDDTDATPED